MALPLVSAEIVPWGSTSEKVSGAGARPASPLSCLSSSTSLLHGREIEDLFIFKLISRDSWTGRGLL